MIHSKSIDKEIRNFYFGPLMRSFPPAARPHLEPEFPKYLWEVSQILSLFPSRPGSRVEFLDIGAGLGINAMILSHLFGYQCHIVDRLSEFAPEENRVVGDRSSLIQRLKHYDVHVEEVDFIAKGFPYVSGSFDLVTCFSVIEHLPFSPRKLISDISGLLKPSGVFLLSTPNQAHIFNRIKAVLGRNTWEDFEYYYSAKHFFGHVRELLPRELELLIRREPCLEFQKIVYSNFPLKTREEWLRSRIGYWPSRIGMGTISAMMKLFPSLMYDMLAISKKVR